MSLTGKWRIAARPALVLALTGAAGTALVAYAPKDWVLIRTVALGLAMFASGMLASQHAAIWEKAEHEETTGKASMNNERG